MSATSGLDPDTVRENCQSFLARSPSGYMKMKENTFRMFDTDHDGQISMEEFLILYQILSGGTPEENLKRIFMMFDVDCDGILSKKELRKIVKDMSKFMAENNQEKYGDDLITESAWQEMDKNKDGAVTQQEFIAAVMAKDKFSQFLTKNVVDLFT